jgi:phosphatidylglycerophosphate synthase
MVIAALLVPVVWTGSFSTAALLLALGWLSDFADGKLARGAETPTHLGDWDLATDTLVGAALVVGLVGLGVMPPLVGLGLALALGTLFIAGNVAASMLLQLLGYLPFLFLLWTHRPPLWWVPFVTAALLAVVDWRRLVLINIPAFLRGVTGRFEGRKLS